MKDKYEQLIEYLSGFVTDQKMVRIQQVLPLRTRHLTIVLEDIFQSHNASAVLRSCECFGIQDVHIIEQQYRYQINPDITLGSSQWLSLHRYRDASNNNTLNCLKNLKEKGYQLIATTLREDSISIDDVPLHAKTALCFGTEESGLSQEVHQLADVHASIPMYGFTKSFNISVSVAICLYALTKKLHASTIHWQLTPEERQQLTIEWLTKIIPQGLRIKEKFLEQYK